MLDENGGIAAFHYYYLISFTCPVTAISFRTTSYPTRICRHRPAYQCPSRNVTRRSQGRRMYFRHPLANKHDPAVQLRRMSFRSPAYRGRDQTCNNQSVSKIRYAQATREYKQQDSQSRSQTNNRTNTIESNFILRVLDCHRLRRIDHRCFGRIVPSQPRSRPDASRRSDCYKAAAIALLLHVWDHDVGRVVD